VPANIALGDGDDRLDLITVSGLLACGGTFDMQIPLTAEGGVGNDSIDGGRLRTSSTSRSMWMRPTSVSLTSLVVPHRSGGVGPSAGGLRDGARMRPSAVEHGAAKESNLPARRATPAPGF
jgi:hypothetical protein